MHHVLVRDVGVREDDLVHFVLRDQGLELVLRLDRDAVRVALPGELGGVDAPSDVGDLGRGEGDDLVVFTFGNGVPMSLRAAREIERKHKWKVRVVDLRWLVPLNEDFIRAQAQGAKRILIVDEGRRSAGVGEGIVTAIVEGGYGARPFQRVVGVDTFTPLAGAAFLVIPSDEDIVAAADRLAG